MKKMIGLTLALSLLVSLCPMAMAMDFLNLRMFQNFTYEEDVHVIGNAPNGMGTNGATNGNYLVCKDTEPVSYTHLAPVGAEGHQHLYIRNGL